MTERTPRELIQLYWEEVWNKGNVDLIREICADPIVRYDVGSTATSLSHDAQIARVAAHRRELKPHFTHEVLLADDEHVVSAWNMTSPINPDYDSCGMELFRAAGGRLVACWNAPYAKGRWGQDGDPAIPAHLGAPEVVCGAQEITTEWLQKVFKSAGFAVPRLAGIFDIAPIGHGTTARTLRVRFAYNADPGVAPQSVIVKLPAGDPAVQRNMDEQGIYLREVAAYRFFGAGAPGCIPRSYFAGAAPGGAFNIVLEDLAEGWSPGNQIGGCSVEEAEAVVRECTALHLHYWADPALPDLEWPLRLSAIAAPFAERYRQGAALMRSNYADILTDRELDLIDEAASLIESFYARPPRYSTLIHGDPRVDNILFRHGPRGVEAKLLDFQVAGIGDPLFDLAYFLSGSVDPAARRIHERRLVAEHAHAMATADASYDADEAWERYCAHGIVALAATGVAAAVIGRSAYIDRLLVTLAQRNCAAIRDLDGLSHARRHITPN
jgi:hypothetical protein